jgi:hypothetical protein
MTQQLFEYRHPGRQHRIPDRRLDGFEVHARRTLGRRDYSLDFPALFDRDFSPFFSAPSSVSLPRSSSPNRSVNSPNSLHNASKRL